MDCGGDAPREYGPPKRLYNRWKRRGDKGIVARMMEGLASEAAAPKTVMIDAIYLKAHRTTTSLRSKKGGSRRLHKPSDRSNQMQSCPIEHGRLGIVIALAAAELRAQGWHDLPWNILEPRIKELAFRNSMLEAATEPMLLARADLRARTGWAWNAVSACWPRMTRCAVG